MMLWQLSHFAHWAVLLHVHLELRKAYTHEQRSPQDSVHEWLTAVTTTGLLDQPPSIAESHVTSIGRERQSSLPMGADAALMQPVQSARSSRLTRRSSSSASVVLAELVNFARGTTESMVRLYDQNRADANFSTRCEP